MNSITETPNDEAPKPRMPWRVEPVGRARGRRLGGYSSAALRREGMTAEEAKAFRKRAPQHHVDHSVDPWLGLVAGEEQA